MSRIGDSSMNTAPSGPSQKYMPMPRTTGIAAEIAGSRCLRGRSGGAGSSTFDAAVRPGHAWRPVELDAVARGDGLDGAQVVADLEAEVADLGVLAGPQHLRRGDRDAVDDDAVLRAEVGDRHDVGDVDAAVPPADACWSLMTMSQSRSRPSRLSP